MTEQQMVRLSISAIDLISQLASVAELGKGRHYAGVPATSHVCTSYRDRTCQVYSSMFSKAAATLLHYHWCLENVMADASEVAPSALNVELFTLHSTFVRSLLSLQLATTDVKEGTADNPIVISVGY
jgi:hypothetical protein